MTSDANLLQELLRRIADLEAIHVLDRYGHASREAQNRIVDRVLEREGTIDENLDIPDSPSYSREQRPDA